MKKRNLGILAALLALCMVLVMLPAGVYADEGWDGSVDTSWYDTEATAFTITTPAQLAGLAAIVNGTAEGIEMDSFAGKTVTLGADIDLNNQPWTSIGHRTDVFGFDAFSGCFDGNGHRITNLSVSYNVDEHFLNSDGSYATAVGAVGLFGYVQGTEANRAIIKNLYLQGSVLIYGSDPSGTNAPSLGMIGGLAGGASYADITDCVVDVSVTSTFVNQGIVVMQGMGGVVGYAVCINIERCANLGDINSGHFTYVGGLIGQLQTVPSTVKDCYNRGSVASPEKGEVGGLIGYANFKKSTSSTIINCYTTGVVSGNGTSEGGFFGKISVKGTVNSGNLYYLNTVSSKAVGSGTGITPVAKTADEMMAPEFVEALNSNNAWKAGLTYPILVCQPDEVTQVVAGDINNSGIVDENDLTLLIGHVLGTDPLSDLEQKTAADINGNGYIDENDVTYLIQIILHL